MGMIEYHTVWTDSELPAVLHRLRDAGGGEAWFGRDERGEGPGIDDPKALQSLLFKIGYAQRPRIIPETSVDAGNDGRQFVLCRVREFRITDMPCFVP